LGVPALQFKGSGWYVTDYGGGRSTGTTKTGEANGGPSSGEKSEAVKGSDTSDSGDGSD
jgi:predicted nucleic acid-binding Zn ribbon protein